MEPLRAGGHDVFPNPPTTLIGREDEIGSVVDLIQRDGVRLVTLTGPGGVGKTRLALAVATALTPRFADGAVFVELAAIADPTQVVPAIAVALGVRETGDAPLAGRLAAALRERRLLLVLDNFEHVIDASSAIADLLAAPRLTVLVTSRVRLRLSGEHELPVLPLRLPSDEQMAPETVADSASVRLFVARTAAVHPGFALTAENAHHVAGICRRLDGLPLALELAAAWIKVLPPGALLARLDRRLPLLTGGPRDLPERQRTMRDTIAWSYDLLSPDDQSLFCTLSVFAGSFSLEAAEMVADADAQGFPVLRGMAALVDASLVRALDPVVGEARFGMLETVREFGRERLAARGDEDDARRRHASYVVSLVDRAEPEFHGSNQRDWWARLDAEHANVVAALTWFGQTGDAAGLLRLAVALTDWWVPRGRLAEARDWLDRALALGGAPSLQHAALFERAKIAYLLGDLNRAVLLVDQALPHARSVGDGAIEGRLLYLLAIIAWFRADAERGRALGQEAIDTLRAAGDRIWLAWALGDIGVLAALAGDRDEVPGSVADGLALHRSNGNTLGAACLLADSGAVAHGRGELAEAARAYGESLRLLAGLGETWWMATSLVGLAGLASASGRFLDAAHLLGAAQRLRAEETGAPQATEGNRAAHVEAETRRALGADVFRAEMASGRVDTLDHVLEIAFELVALTDRSPAQRAGDRSTGPCGLTPREEEVLRLLVSGASDREIADALFIGRRTVQTHVGNLIAKLGVRSRTEAASVAVRFGVVDIPPTG